MNSGALQSPHDCSNSIGIWGTNRIQMDFGAEAGFLWLDFQGKNGALLWLKLSASFFRIWNTFVTRCKFTSWNIGILPPTELYWPLSLGAAAKSKLWTSAGHFLVCCLAKISEACIGCWAVDQNTDSLTNRSTLRTDRWTDREQTQRVTLHFQIAQLSIATTETRPRRPPWSSTTWPMGMGECKHQKVENLSIKTGKLSGFKMF